MLEMTIKKPRLSLQLPPRLSTEFQAAVVLKFNFGDFCFVIFTPSWFFEWKLSRVAQQVLLWAIPNEDVQYFSILNLGQAFRVLQILSRHEWNLSKKRGVCRKKNAQPVKNHWNCTVTNKKRRDMMTTSWCFLLQSSFSSFATKKCSPKGPGRQVTFPSEGDEIGSTGKAQVSIQPIREWMRNPWVLNFSVEFFAIHENLGLLMKEMNRREAVIYMV